MMKYEKNSQSEILTFLKKFKLDKKQSKNSDVQKKELIQNKRVCLCLLKTILTNEAKKQHGRLAVH